MWICIKLFATVDGNPTVWTYLAAGLAFSLVNAIIKPIATLLSLPFIVFTIGIFTIIVNTAMVSLSLIFVDSVHMPLWGAALTSIVISLINYLVSLIVPGYNKTNITE
jgi:putative membrane protein